MQTLNDSDSKSITELLMKFLIYLLTYKSFFTESNFAKEQSINQSFEAYAEGHVASLPPTSAITPRVSMQAPFPYQVIPNMNYLLAPATNLVGAPLASSTPVYLSQG